MHFLYAAEVTAPSSTTPKRWLQYCASAWRASSPRHCFRVLAYSESACAPTAAPINNIAATTRRFIANSPSEHQCSQMSVALDEYFGFKRAYCEAGGRLTISILAP